MTRGHKLVSIIIELIQHTTERKKYFHPQDVSQKQFRNRFYLS